MPKKIENVGFVRKSIKVKRVLWSIVYILLFRPLPTSLFWWWRCFLLKAFGAKVSVHSMVYSSVKIWAPWNLKMAAGSCLGPNVICYNQAMVVLEEGATVSQYAYLCTAGHDITQVNSASKGLIISPIIIGEYAWIGTRAFIGMGVHVGEFTIVGAAAAVFKDVEPYTIVGGNPAKEIKKRVINER